MSDVPTLYYAPRSSALPARLALEEADAEYRIERVDLANGMQRTAAFASLNPMGRVPVLIEGDFVLTENGAILPYIARRYPDARLWPDRSGASARCAEWLAWGASNVHPAMAHVRRPERYAASEAGRADVVARARMMLADLFTIGEARLPESGWATGDTFSVADLYLLFFWIWGPGADGVEAYDRHPRWAALADRVRDRPAVQRVLESEG